MLNDFIFLTPAEFISRYLFSTSLTTHLRAKTAFLGSVTTGANLIRLHGGYVSENEIDKIVKFINLQSTSEIQMDITADVISSNNDRFEFEGDSQNVDTLYQQAVSIVIQKQKLAFRNQLQHLSMGMSNDYETAITEGATHIRIGVGLFGARPN